MNTKNLPSFIIVIIFFTTGFFLINQASQNKNSTPEINISHVQIIEAVENIKYVKIARQVIRVDLALTNTEQAQGLSGRSGLKENEGMLFVFQESGKYPFWMQDMNFAIDIIWLAEDRKVIYIKKDARPEFFPEIYGPQDDAKYVLEVVAGFSDRNNLKVGDDVEFAY